MTGAAIEIPALAVTVWIVARLGVGDPDVGLMQIMRLTTVFAGGAALLTAAGIGRLAAHAAAIGGRPRAIMVAARAHAVASAGLVIIAAIPHGHVPADSWAWLPLPLAGLVTGALCGALIGAVCGGTAPVGLADVWSIARKPSDVIRYLVGTEDIGKLGSALRSRTTTLFAGIFDPAPPPPAAPDAAPVAAAEPNVEPAVVPDVVPGSPATKAP